MNICYCCIAEESSRPIITSDDANKDENDPYSDDILDAAIEDIDEDDIFKDIHLRHSLRSWTLQFNIHHTALKALLQILKTRYGRNGLPQDPRTLMETPLNVTISPVGKGIMDSNFVSKIHCRTYRHQCIFH